MENLNRYIDHTLLKQDASIKDIDRLIQEAKDFNFKTVCVNPTFIKYCKENLRGTEVEVCTVIGFPLGAMTTASKVFEAKNALEEGADEIDMVINISKLKDGDMAYVIRDIKEVKEAIKDKTLKVIIETCLLNDEEKIRATRAIIEAGGDFVKTSTGFSLAGANVEDVKLLKKASENKTKVKAAGGVRSYQDLIDMILAGADRIGTSSGTKLLKK